jgi:cytochrome c peroxidase
MSGQINVSLVSAVYSKKEYVGEHNMTPPNLHRSGLLALLFLATTAPLVAAQEAVVQTAAAATQADVVSLFAKFHRDDDIPYPDENPPTPAKIALGHSLFFDPRLSASGSQSCGSCHNPSLAWGDGLPVGRGNEQKALARRSPTILNLAWGEPLMWDGRMDSLEDQAMGPMKAEAEMNMPTEQLVATLQGIEGYRQMFVAAFDSSAAITPDQVAMAIASYERTVVSGSAPFDHWLEGDAAAISDPAKRGAALFVGKANCAACHDGWRFTDDSFHDIGLKGEDLGRGRLFPAVESLQHAFKTPGLRNIDRRAPYMHDGQLATLTEVVQHYNQGGLARPSRSDEIYPLGLQEQEVADLVAFLHTLTSEDDPVTAPVLPR